MKEPIELQFGIVSTTSTLTQAHLNQFRCSMYVFNTEEDSLYFYHKGDQYDQESSLEMLTKRELSAEKIKSLKEFLKDNKLNQLYYLTPEQLKELNSIMEIMPVGTQETSLKNTKRIKEYDIQTPSITNKNTIDLPKDDNVVLENSPAPEPKITVEDYQILLTQLKKIVLTVSKQAEMNEKRTFTNYFNQLERINKQTIQKIRAILVENESRNTFELIKNAKKGLEQASNFLGRFSSEKPYVVVTAELNSPSFTEETIQSLLKGWTPKQDLALTEAITRELNNASDQIKSDILVPLNKQLLSAENKQLEALKYDIRDFIQAIDSNKEIYTSTALSNSIARAQSFIEQSAMSSRELDVTNKALEALKTQAQTIKEDLQNEIKAINNDRIKNHTLGSLILQGAVVLPAYQQELNAFREQFDSISESKALVDKESFDALFARFDTLKMMNLRFERTKFIRKRVDEFYGLSRIGESPPPIKLSLDDYISGTLNQEGFIVALGQHLANRESNIAPYFGVLSKETVLSFYEMMDFIVEGCRKIFSVQDNRFTFFINEEKQKLNREVSLDKLQQSIATLKNELTPPNPSMS